ncbi:hypothetical protein OAJ39_01610 [Alphaproteobacteria bacterium]|nr:hypothetical protein [Alphaproteobacteria bacterium]
MIFIKQQNTADWLFLYGLLTLPLTYLLSKPVFAASYIFGVSFLTFWLLTRMSFRGWLVFFLSLAYLFVTAILRLEYPEVSFRFLAIIIVITSAFRLAYIYGSRKLKRLLRYIACIGLVSALFGLKQYLFGYTDYEIMITSNVGSIGREFLTLNIARSLGISFDPLSQALLLGISFHCFVFINTSAPHRFYKIIYLFAQFLIVVSLLLTLNRTGILAFILSLSIYLNFGMWVRTFSQVSGIFRIVILAVFLCLLFYVLSLPEFDYPRRSLLSVFELFGIGDDSDEFFNRGQSIDKRVLAAQTVVEFVKQTPFGIRNEVVDFTLNDTGILAPIFKYGLLGGGVIITLIYFPLVGVTRYFFARGQSIRDEASSRLIYGCYLVISVSSLVSFSLDGTIMMLPAWFFICLAIRNTIRQRLEAIVC